MRVLVDVRSTYHFGPELFHFGGVRAVHRLHLHAILCGYAPKYF